MAKTIDPNKHLDKMRAQVNYVIAFAGMAPADAVDLAEQIKSLDEWLSDPAGYLPEAWSRGLDGLVLLVRKLAALGDVEDKAERGDALGALIEEARRALGQ